MSKGFGAELLYFVETGYAPEYLDNLKTYDTLQHLFPELYNCIGVSGGPQHNEDVYTHCVDALRAAIEWKYSIDLRLSCLFHDIGKPKSYRKENGAVHFHSHELTGSNIAYSVCKRFGYKHETCEYVSWAVRYHMYRIENDTGNKTLRRWLYNVGKDWRDLFSLRAADRRANKAKVGRNSWSKTMLEQFHLLTSIENAGYTFSTDLHLPIELIDKINKSKQKDSIYTNLLGLVRESNNRNNEEWLTAYFNQVYKL